MRSVCVLGGSRYFGRRLVDLLREAGDSVTVLNRGSATPPPGVTHLIADRDDPVALRAAVAGKDFDVVIDQICYTPTQAAVAAQVFDDRTGRYLLTSTIEVYDRFDAATVLTEDAVGPDWPVDPDLPWSAPGYLDDHYGEGKRQAEAVLAASGLPFVAIRCGHVLGSGDFTGRLEHYVDLLRAGKPITVHEREHPSSYIAAAEIAEFVRWAAQGSWVGPVNACSTGEVLVTDLCDGIAGPGRAGYRVAEPGEATSPFSFDRYYGMANTRARDLGFPFSATEDWLPAVLADVART